MATVNEIIEIVLKAKPSDFTSITEALVEVVLSPESLVNFEWSEDGEIRITERGEKEYIAWTFAAEKEKFGKYPKNVRDLIKDATLKRLAVVNRAYKNIPNLLLQDIEEIELDEGIVGTLSGSAPSNISSDWSSALATLFGSDKKDDEAPVNSEDDEMEESELDADKFLDDVYQ